MTPTYTTVGVVGAGAMGRGIAQIAAQAGSTVKLYDTQPQAVAKARDELFSQWDRLLEKGRMDAAAVQACKQRLQAADSLQALADCDLVVEAVVERLDVKKALFAELEAIVRPGAVLATNTSSLSVTAIAAGLKRPQRFAGYHFFNPVPLMKVVEVVAGLKTDPAVCAGLAEYARQMGHTPVQAQDTPGFIVNHAGRGYGTEALRIVGEGVADFATIDRILKDQVGFKLGPFELMDLTGAGRLASGDGVDLPAVLRRAALPAQRDHGAAAGGRRGRQEGRRRLLPLRGRQGAGAGGAGRSRKSPRCRRCGCRPAPRAAPSCTSCSRTWARRSKPGNRPPRRR